MSLREASKSLKRQRILSAARSRFSREGFEQATIRSIAADAGVGVGTVLLYAESKHGLLHAVWREVASGVLEQALESAVDKPLLDGAMLLFEPFLRAYAADLPLARVVIKELPWLEGRAFEQHQPDLTRFVSALSALVSAGQVEGRVRARLDPGVAAAVLFSLYYSACLELTTPNGTPAVEVVLRNLRERLQAVVSGWTEER
jgi:AcrR family transcriptional regulator